MCREKTFILAWMVTAFSSMCPWKLPVPQCLNGACILGKVGNLGCSTFLYVVTPCFFAWMATCFFYCLAASSFV